MNNFVGNCAQARGKNLRTPSTPLKKTHIINHKNIMLKQIINAKILTPQGWLKDGSVIIRDNKILEVTNCDLAVIGAEEVDA